MDSNDRLINYSANGLSFESETIELQRMVRAFAEKEISKAQEKMDESHDFPYDCWQKYLFRKCSPLQSKIALCHLDWRYFRYDVVSHTTWVESND